MHGFPGSSPPATRHATATTWSACAPTAYGAWRTRKHTGTYRAARSAATARCQPWGSRRCGAAVFSRVLRTQSYGAATAALCDPVTGRCGPRRIRATRHAAPGSITARATSPRQMSREDVTACGAAGTGAVHCPGWPLQRQGRALGATLRADPSPWRSLPVQGHRHHTRVAGCSPTVGWVESPRQRPRSDPRITAIGPADSTFPRLLR